MYCREQYGVATIRGARQKNGLSVAVLYSIDPVCAQIRNFMARLGEAGGQMLLLGWKSDRSLAAGGFCLAAPREERTATLARQELSRSSRLWCSPPVIFRGTSSRG